MAIYRKVSWKRAARFAKKYPTGRKRKAIRARNSRMTRLIKRTVMKTTEPKEKVTSWGGKYNLFHNTWNTWLINDGNSTITMPTQGAGDNQRVGDQIYISGFKIKCLYGQQVDRPNVTFRWMIVKVPKAAPYSYASWFTATSNNILLDDANTDYIKVLKSGWMRPNEAGLAGTGGDEYTFAKRYYLPYKKLLKFGPGSLTAHNDDDIYFMVAPYDAFGTLTTDNIAYVQVSSSIYYKDP